MSDERVTIQVHQHPSGSIGLSIYAIREGGWGHGYRICGPKLNCSGATLLREYELDERDAKEITGYLARLLPAPPQPVLPEGDGQ